jgi:hypothetical protein
VGQANLAHSPQPEEWFVLEIIAAGQGIHVQINGREVVRCTERDLADAASSVLLQCQGNSKVRFRKVEIKDLSVDPPGPRKEADRRPPVLDDV